MNKIREYRGMRTDNGEWVYGDLMHGVKEQKGYAWIWQETEDELGVHEYQIIPETVGQEIGIIDKNGKKIYSGDIVEYNEEYGQIEYHDSEAMYVVSFDTWFTDFDHICGIDVEVVGTVYEHPEMLGGK